jgi:hypothetical protein
VDILFPPSKEYDVAAGGAALGAFRHRRGDIEVSCCQKGSEAKFGDQRIRRTQAPSSARSAKWKRVARIGMNATRNVALTHGWRFVAGKRVPALAREKGEIWS